MRREVVKKTFKNEGKQDPEARPPVTGKALAPQKTLSRLSSQREDCGGEQTRVLVSKASAAGKPWRLAPGWHVPLPAGFRRSLWSPPRVHLTPLALVAPVLISLKTLYPLERRVMRRKETLGRASGVNRNAAAAVLPRYKPVTGLCGFPIT